MSLKTNMIYFPPSNYISKSTPAFSFIVVNCLIIMTFSILHYLSAGFNKKLNFFDSLYYSIITHTTVGYGDFYPDSVLSKILTCIHVLMVFFLLSSFSYQV